MSSVKVAVVLGIIFLCIILASGGGPNHDATGFRYWKDPGAFNHFIKSKFRFCPLGRLKRC